MVAKGRRGLAPEKPAAGGDVALAGPDGSRIAALLAASQAEGRRVFAEVSQAAVGRLLKGRHAGLSAKTLFDDGERQRLADVLAAATATADLLARVRVRERRARAESSRGLHKHGDGQPFALFAEPVAPLPPDQALAYFRGLVPKLGVDPERFGPQMQRHAFTLAAAADDVVLKKVQASIRGGLAGGANAAPDVQEILDAAGVGARNPQYADMVVRTNQMDAYTTAAHAEMQSPDVAETFPVWQYLGIRDGRQGPDHEPKFDRYYPNSADFADVRGDRPFNCRCCPAPIDRWQWAELQAGGAAVEESW